MAKKRLIFTLLYQDEAFWLSRNFRLQRVGGCDWLEKNYCFSSVAAAVDELVVLDVSRSRRDLGRFCDAVDRVTSHCFVPLSLGGGVRSADDAALLVSRGADKLVINTALAVDPDLVRDLVSIYGSQCIVASVDYRRVGDSFRVYVDQGQRCVDLALSRYVEQLALLGVGELYLNSIDRDGTGQGYCLEALDDLPTACHLPIIMAGGAGSQNHLLEGVRCPRVDAVATANLFNFIGDGLPNARSHLIANGVTMAKW